MEKQPYLAIILSALFVLGFVSYGRGETYGELSYTVVNGEIKITAYEGISSEIVIPAVINGMAVKTIGKQSFQGTSITSINIPSTLSTIEELAFQNCQSLSIINIPSSVSSIGNNAFQLCTSLKEVTLPAGLSNVSWALFQFCSNLEKVNLPASITRVNGFAFESCPKLKTINLSENLTSIGMSAFDGCSSLNTITLPSTLTALEDNVFANCANLSGVYFLGNAPTRGANLFVGSTPTIYYLSGAVGWLSYYAGRPTALAGSYALTVSCDSAKGTISINPNTPYYISGAAVTVTAYPKAGYLFTSWNGSATDLTASISLTMNQNKALTATFNQDSADSDGDGLTNFQESITYGSNPNQKDSNADGIEDGHAVSMGYSPTLNFSALVAHPPTGLYTASQMQAMAFGDLVLTKNGDGSFTLNYDIEKSTDLQTWTPYQALSLPLTGLPADKAFVRIKVINSTPNPPNSSPNPSYATPSTSNL